MLIEFSVKNYRSFKERMTLSMEAGTVSELETSNTLLAEKLHLVKCVAIYGPNASGKSNLLKAMRFMRTVVLDSSKESQSGELIPVEPFSLNSSSINEPSLFEIVFFHEGIRYRYGFEANQSNVVSEWLFTTTKQAEKFLFTREGQQFNLSAKFKEGKGLEERTRPNTLFLSLVAQFNGSTAIKVLDWFGTQLRAISGLQDSGNTNFTVKRMHEDNDKIQAFLKLFDLGFTKIGSREMDKQEVFDKLTSRGATDEFISKVTSAQVVYELFTTHTTYNDNNVINGTVDLDFRKTASEGTKKIFALAGPLIDTLEAARILIFDELDARLHPLLSRKIIEIFNSSETNPKGAQLIFATHDTNLLSNQLLRRDQIWFTEKMPNGATDLYSLVDFIVDGKKVRNDASYSKDYILGKYGAIPYIGDFRSVFGGSDE